MQDPLRLSELLCARLCHDLSGPLGSLLGLTDLSADEPSEAEAIAVAAEAAVILAGRIRLLRAAWGGGAAPMAAGEIEDLIAAMIVGRRVTLDLSAVDREGVFTPDETRVLLNLLLLAVEGAGAGRVVLAGGAGHDLVVTIAGPRAAWPPGLAACLIDEEAAWNALGAAGSIQGPLTALMAHRAGLRLSMALPAAKIPTVAGGPPPLVMSCVRRH